MVLASSGKITATALYDVVTCSKFVAEWNDEHRAQLEQILQANLHLFSSRQQRAVLVEIPPADAVAARGSASCESNFAEGGATVADLQTWRPKQGWPMTDVMRDLYAVSVGQGFVGLALESLPFRLTVRIRLIMEAGTRADAVLLN